MRANWQRAVLTGAILYVALQFVPVTVEGQARALAAAALAGLAAVIAGKLILT